MKKKEKLQHPFSKFIDEIPVIAFKGLIGCLVIGLILEIIGYNIIQNVTLKTHFWGTFGAIFGVGIPIHYFKIYFQD